MYSDALQHSNEGTEHICSSDIFDIEGVKDFIEKLYALRGVFFYVGSFI